MSVSMRVMSVVVGIIVVGSTHAAQAGDRVRWRFEIPSNFSGKFIGVGADGRVYTTNFAGDLYALRPNGSLVWSLDLGVAASHWPITFADDGTIYTGAAREVVAVNPDGTPRWAFDSGAWLISGPTVGPDGNIYAADDGIVVGGRGFFALDADGNPLWSDPGDPPITGLYEGLDEIVFGQDRFFAGIHFMRSGPWINTYAFDLDGHQLWNRYNVGLEGGPSSNPRMLPDGRLVFRWGQGSLAALHQDGTDDWVVPHPDGAQVLVTPAVGPDGSIYGGDEYGVQLWSANPDGTTRWVLGSTSTDHLHADSLGVSPDNEVLIAGGWSWTGAMNVGWIRGYHPADGTLLWQIDLEPEQDLPQFVRTVHPAFSRNGDTAYVTTWFAGDGVGHSYLYAIALREGAAVPGDFDGDGDVDLSDFTVFQLCFGGSNNPPAPTCPPGADADLDSDGDVDLADFLIFQQNFTGSL